MMLICNCIKDFSIYTKANSKRTVQPVAININSVVYFVPMNLWVDGNETTEITRMVLNRPYPENLHDVLYLEHSFEEVRAMLFGMTLVHDYRVEHGTHFVKSEEYPLPKEDDDGNPYI